MGKDPRADDKKLKVYLRYTGAGMQLCITAVIGALVGKWLDGKWGTSPLLLILGTFLGFGAGFYSLYMELFGRRR